MKQEIKEGAGSEASHDENCFLAMGGGGLCNCSLSKEGAAPVLTEAQRAALAQVLELVHHDDIEHPDQSAASILRPLLVAPAPSPEPAEAAPAGAEPLDLEAIEKRMDGYCALSPHVRQLVDVDMPALIAEVRRLAAALTKAQGSR